MCLKTLGGPLWVSLTLRHYPPARNPTHSVQSRGERGFRSTRRVLAPLSTRVHCPGALPNVDPTKSVGSRDLPLPSDSGPQSGRVTVRRSSDSSGPETLLSVSTGVLDGPRILLPPPPFPPRNLPESPESVHPPDPSLLRSVGRVILPRKTVLRHVRAWEPLRTGPWW